MECLVYRVPMRDPGDASGITRLIDEGAIVLPAFMCGTAALDR